jgi:hypothetical protein
MPISIPFLGSTYNVHQKHQDDIRRGGVQPWLCVHRHGPNVSARVACLWPSGVILGPLFVTWQWSSK